jgi:hypothetical protein
MAASMPAVAFVFLALIFHRPGVPMTRFEPFMLGGLLLNVLVVGVIAVVAAPNNRDSMAYHMSRVMHWIQKGSVGFYATAILRTSLRWLPPFCFFASCSGGGRTTAGASCAFSCFSPL